MEDIIQNINLLYNKSLTEDNIITLITKYIYHKKEENNNLDYIKILNNNKILFNQSNNENIIVQIIHNLNNDLLNKDNYNKYVKSIKFILSIFIKNGKYYDNGKNFNKDIQIYDLQYNYLIDNINNLQVIPFNKKYISKLIKQDKRIKGYKKIYYSFQDKKQFNDNMILYSYLCYFKSAINSIKHNELFKYICNIESDTIDIKIKEALTQKEMIGGNKCRDYKYYYIGGMEFMDLFTKESISIIEFVKLYNELTQNIYLIGTPGIKYYPYQIFNEILNLLPLSFSSLNYSNNNYCININNDILTYCNNINEFIEFHLKYNRICYYFNTILNDPMINNVFTSIYNKKIDYKEINNLTYELLHSNVYQYQYNYIIGDYYLESICLIENISKNNKENLLSMDFHNIFIKFIYNDNYELTNIIRYDGSILEYNKENINNKNLKYMKIEYEKIFHKNYISDYIDGDINYKISMICYMNKNFREMYDKEYNQNK